MPIPAEHPVLTDGVVTLRAPRPDDVQGQIERHLEDPQRGRGAEDARRWIDYGITEAWKTGERLVFVIEYQGRYAGTAALSLMPTATRGCTTACRHGLVEPV